MKSLHLKEKNYEYSKNSTGAIIKIDPNPVEGSKQGNYGPHVVISNDVYNSLSSLRILVHISQTGGYVKCQHLKTLDLNSRKYHYIETVDYQLLEEIKKLTQDNIN